MTARHKVTVEPGGFVIEADDGEQLMAAANRQGLYWPTSCAGDAVCTRCYLDVPEESRASFSEMRSLEREGLEKVRWAAGEREGERLGCQARVTADAVVTKKYVRPAKEGDLMPFLDADR